MVTTYSVHFGSDIDSSWAANNQGDFNVVEDLDNARQAVYNRLMTKLGELNQLGYDPNYGNQSTEVIGSTEIETAKAELMIYTQNCLLSEPRVETIQNIKSDFNGKTATINVDVNLIGEDKATNIIINIGEEL